MKVDNALASLAVRDIGRARNWYTSLFDREPNSTPMPNVAEWRFARGGALQVYQLPERAGIGSCTLAVSNIDEVANRVGQLGIGPVERTSSDRVKTLMIVDPDGNHLAFAQALDPSLAR